MVDPYLDAAERRELLELLERSQRELTELVADFGAEDWGRRPTPDEWSVGEVAEHLLRVEERFLDVIRGAVGAQPHSDWERVTAGKAERIRRFVPDRGIAVAAPAGLEPTGEMSREALLERLAGARAASLAFLRETDAAVRRHVRPHPIAFFGDLDVGQWFLFIGEHHLRHNRQIAAIKSTLGPG